MTWFCNKTADKRNLLQQLLYCTKLDRCINYFCNDSLPLETLVLDVVFINPVDKQNKMIIDFDRVSAPHWPVSILYLFQGYVPNFYNTRKHDLSYHT